jgi:hypothetical protein
LVLLPPARGLAQRVWRLFTLGRIEVLKLDPDRLPEGSSLRAKGDRAAGQDGGRGDGGGRSHAGVLDGRPRLSPLGPVAFGITLKADDLRGLLRGAGDGDEVPAAWDGARVVVQTAGTVMAE